MKIKKKILSAVISSTIISLFIVLPIIGICVYEANFGKRYQTIKQYEFSVSDFENLQMQRSDFISNNVKLAGYKYSKSLNEQNPKIKGLVIIAHGLGCGGQNSYMRFADYFTSHGYYVFTFDAKGNDNSEGKTVGGVPQAVVDLDNAIKYAKTIDEYKNLPIMLFGHSWGGYSVANVLNYETEVKAAIIAAGFDRTKDLLFYQGRQSAGYGVDIILPYFLMYERFKFGKKYTTISGYNGLKNSSANVMILHSKDDNLVSTNCGFDKFYKSFNFSPRFKFVIYENRGHDNIFYDQNNFVKVGKKKLYQFDEELMLQVVELFDKSCE